MMKFALSSHVLPPSRSGQAIVLYQLLKNYDPTKYILISSNDYSNTKKSEYYTNKSDTKYYHIPSAFQVTKFFKIERDLALFLKMWGNETLLNRFLSDRAKRVARILQKENCDAIISCTADVFGPPISFLAGKSLNIPFILYAFDQYSTQWTVPHEREFAVEYEKVIAQNARAILVPNEFLKNAYSQLYGVEPVIIHNPCDLSYYDLNQKFIPMRRNGDKIKIMYTGAVYDAHYDAFRTLLSAINSIPNKQLELHIYTGQNPLLLRKNGINGRVVFHEHVEASLIPTIQQGADILYLPLAFNSPYPEIIRTSSPGKMGEYLASGRPILVHAPPDSFISWYFKEYECGFVIDKNDPLDLVKGLDVLINDEALQEKLVQNAKERAIIDFDLKNARKRFFDAIKSAVN